MFSSIDPSSDKGVVLQNILQFGTPYNNAVAVGINQSSILGFQNTSESPATQVTVTYTPDATLAPLIADNSCQLLDSNTNIMSSYTAIADSIDMTPYSTSFNSLLGMS